MPEGDSLHRAAARLRPLVGLRLTATSPHPRGLVTGVAKAIDGRRLEGVEAVGKNLLLRFEGGVTVRSHLRMNGRWRVGPIGSTGAGRPWLLLRGEAVEATQWNGPVLTLDLGPVRRLGPDLLADGSDPAALVARLRRGDGSRPLGEVLQDQRLVAGIGNMWMSEALWAVRLSPWLPLAAGARRGARRGVAVGAVGDARLGCGCAAGSRRVPPRRAPCGRCGTPIVSRGQGDDNRTAYWCPACQPVP